MTATHISENTPTIMQFDGGFQIFPADVASFVPVGTPCKPAPHPEGTADIVGTDLQITISLPPGKYMLCIFQNNELKSMSHVEIDVDRKPPAAPPPMPPPPLQSPPPPYIQISVAGKSAGQSIVATEGVDTVATFDGAKDQQHTQVHTMKMCKDSTVMYDMDVTPPGAAEDNTVDMSTRHEECYALLLTRPDCSHEYYGIAMFAAGPSYTHTFCVCAPPTTHCSETVVNGFHWVFKVEQTVPHTVHPGDFPVWIPVSLAPSKIYTFTVEKAFTAGAGVLMDTTSLDAVKRAVENVYDTALFDISMDYSPISAPQCPADGSMDVCDDWSKATAPIPDRFGLADGALDHLLGNPENFNYLYDVDYNTDFPNTDARRDNYIKYISSINENWFRNNGLCDDGLPSLTGNKQGNYGLKLNGFRASGRIYMPENGQTSTDPLSDGSERPYTDGPWTPGKSDVAYDTGVSYFSYVPCRPGFD